MEVSEILISISIPTNMYVQIMYVRMYAWIEYSGTENVAECLT